MVAPPTWGSMVILSIRPPERIAYRVLLSSQSKRETKGQTHSRYMTQLMPSNGEKLQWVDDIPHDRNIPKSENDDSHGHDLRIFGNMSDHGQKRDILTT